MDIRFENGSLKYLDDCEEALLNSELGRKYFTNEGSGRKAILEGLEQGTLYVALINDICIGFIFYLPKGAFHSFPFVHLLSVKEEYRNKGVGKKIMGFLEDTVFEIASKIFLVVADFEKFGYKQVGEIPSLYRKGITEYLMMKERNII